MSTNGKCYETRYSEMFSMQCFSLHGCHQYPTSKCIHFNVTPSPLFCTQLWLDDQTIYSLRSYQALSVEDVSLCVCWHKACRSTCVQNDTFIKLWDMLLSLAHLVFGWCCATALVEFTHTRWHSVTLVPILALNIDFIYLFIFLCLH